MNTYKPEGMLISSFQNSEYISTRRGLELALERQIILEAGVILCDHNFNLHVALGGKMKGIIPREEVEFSSREEIKDIAILTRVGKTVCFKVMGFQKNAYGEAVAILSRRQAQLKDGTLKVFDCSKFTVDGKNITSYKADVDSDDKFTPDTEVIKTEGDVTYFAESEFRSAPYFDIIIDGISIGASVVTE